MATSVTDFLQEVSDVLQDVGGVNAKFPEQLRLRNAERQLQRAFRAMTIGPKDHGNFLVSVNRTRATQVSQTLFDYRLWTWIKDVWALHLRAADGDAADTNPSVYVVGGSDLQLGQEVQKGIPEYGPGWTREGHRSIRLWNVDRARDLLLFVSKTPPAMFRATLTQAHADLDKLYLPAVPDEGVFGLEEGGLINAEITVTATASGTSSNLGEVRRVVYSTPTATFGGARVHELRFDAPFPQALVANDVVETAVPFPDEHLRYLVLLTARACLMRPGHKTGLQAIAEEMREERAEFLAFAMGPRDSAGPYFYKRGRRYGRVTNPDKRFGAI